MRYALQEHGSWAIEPRSICLSVLGPIYLLLIWLLLIGECTCMCSEHIHPNPQGWHRLSLYLYIEQKEECLFLTLRWSRWIKRCAIHIYMRYALQKHGSWAIVLHHLQLFISFFKQCMTSAWDSCVVCVVCVANSTNLFGCWTNKLKFWMSL